MEKEIKIILPYKNFSLENIKDEIWRDIDGLEGHYEISNFGRVKSLERKVLTKTGYFHHVKPRIRKQKLNESTLVVRLRSKELEIDKYSQVSRLVAAAFMNLEDHQFVFHKDIDITNNQLNNLELGDKNNFAEVQKKVKDKYGRSKKIKSINTTASIYRGVHHQSYYVMSISSKEHSLNKSEIFKTEEEAARRYDYYVKKFNLKRKTNF